VDELDDRAIEEGLRLESEATRGRWDTGDPESPHVVWADMGAGQVVARVPLEADARLVVHARNHYAEALSEVRRLRSDQQPMERDPTLVRAKDGTSVPTTAGEVTYRGGYIEWGGERWWSANLLKRTEDERDAALARAEAAERKLADTRATVDDRASQSVAEAVLVGQPVWLLDPRATHDPPQLCIGTEAVVRASLTNQIGETWPKEWVLYRLAADLVEPTEESSIYPSIRARAKAVPKETNE